MPTLADKLLNYHLRRERTPMPAAPRINTGYTCVACPFREGDRVATVADPSLLGVVSRIGKEWFRGPTLAHRMVSVVMDDGASRNFLSHRLVAAPQKRSA